MVTYLDNCKLNPRTYFHKSVYQKTGLTEISILNQSQLSSTISTSKLFYWLVKRLHSMHTRLVDHIFGKSIACYNKPWLCSKQSHYREVLQWEIFMKQESRFGSNGRRSCLHSFKNLLTYETIIYLKNVSIICGTFWCIKSMYMKL